MLTLDSDFMLPTTRSRFQAGAGALLLLGATLIVFAGVVANGFTWWDDQRTIHHNAQFNPPSREGIVQTWKKPAYGLYVPLTYSYWGALALAATKAPDEYGISLDPRVYHAASLALHVASVLVAFAVLRLLGGGVWPSVAGAMVFAIHPVQVEPVAWASGAKDLLAGLLSLCAIHQYLVYARTPDHQRARRRIYSVSGCALLVLAMLAKPSAMVVPAVAAILDRVVLKRPWRRVAWSVAPWALVVVPLAVVASLAQTAQGVAHVTWWQKPLIAADAIAFYLGKLAWPAPLAPDYGRRPAIVLGLWNGWWIGFIWIVPALATALAWRFRHRAPGVWAGWLVFVASLLPVLGFVPFMFQYMSTVADHYLYPAMIGPAMILSAALSAAASRRSAELPARRPLLTGRMAAAAACIVIAGLLGARSAWQLRVWRDDPSLWAHTMAACPDSFVAPNNLAANLGRKSVLLALAASDAREKGDLERAGRIEAQRREALLGAVALLERSVALNPDYLTARHNAFVNYMRLGDARGAVAHVEGMMAANARVPEHMRDDCTKYHEAAGVLWMKLSRYDRAADHFRALLAATPDDPEARQSLAEAEAKLAEARIE